MLQTPRRVAPIAVTSRIFRAFSSSDYRWLFLGSLVSNTGTWVQKTAQGWLVLTLSDSAFYLGLDAFAGDLPIMLFSLVGGVMADRFHRKRLLIGAQVARFLLAVILTVLAYQGSIQVWHLITISLLAGCVDAVLVPTYHSFLPTLVPRRDLASALALNSVQFNLSRVAGPALAGILLAAGGAPLCFLVNSVSFLAVILGLVRVRLPEKSPSGRAKTSMLTSLTQGAAYVRRHRTLPHYLISVLFFSLCASPLVTLLPLFARDVLGTGQAGFSRMLSLFGTGAVLGALGVAGATEIRRRVDPVLIAMTVFALSALGFALSRHPGVSSALMLIAGASMLASSVMLNTMIQSESSPVFRGRVTSVYGMAFRGGMPIGNLLSGSIAALWGGPAAVTVHGALLLGYVCVFLLFLRRRFNAPATIRS